MKEKGLLIVMTVVNRPTPKITLLPRKSNTVSTFRRNFTQERKKDRKTQTNKQRLTNCDDGSESADAEDNAAAAEVE
jgi:hypothetical protein